jgi:phosphatidylserine/phosphatidylglycerophosphate/cardiolipin synthase-like enzyme
LVVGYAVYQGASVFEALAERMEKIPALDVKMFLVSSANFTKAGQERNIEVGLNIESAWLAQRLVRHFHLLHEHGLAVRERLVESLASPTLDEFADATYGFEVDRSRLTESDRPFWTSLPQ